MAESFKNNKPLGHYVREAYYYYYYYVREAGAGRALHCSEWLETSCWLPSGYTRQLTKPTFGNSKVQEGKKFEADVAEALFGAYFMVVFEHTRSIDADIEAAMHVMGWLFRHSLPSDSGHKSCICTVLKQSLSIGQPQSSTEWQPPR